MARELSIFVLGATVAVLLGRGYYNSFRTGELKTIKGFAARRDQEPIKYWLGMLMGTFAFLLVASGAAVMAFVVFMDLSQRYVR